MEMAAKAVAQCLLRFGLSMIAVPESLAMTWLEQSSPNGCRAPQNDASAQLCFCGGAESSVQLEY